MAEIVEAEAGHEASLLKTETGLLLITFDLLFIKVLQDQVAGLGLEQEVGPPLLLSLSRKTGTA